MITVMFVPERFSMSIEGHAESAICAAATMLQGTLEASLEPEKFRSSVGWVSTGRYHLTACPSASALNECRIIFSTVLSGYELLSRVYPEAVRLIKKGDF